MSRPCGLVFRELPTPATHAMRDPNFDLPEQESLVIVERRFRGQPPGLHPPMTASAFGTKRTSAATARECSAHCASELAAALV